MRTFNNESNYFVTISNVAHAAAQRIYLVSFFFLLLLFFYIILNCIDQFFLFFLAFHLFCYFLQFFRKVRALLLPKIMSFLDLSAHLPPVMLFNYTAIVALAFELKGVIEVAKTVVFQEERNAKVFRR